MEEREAKMGPSPAGKEHLVSTRALTGEASEQAVAGRWVKQHILVVYY